MTIPVLFLVGAVGLSVVLSVVVWLFSRPRKPKFGSTVETFSSDLSALAPSRRAGDGRNGTHSGYVSNGQASTARPKPGPRARK